MKIARSAESLKWRYFGDRRQESNRTTTISDFNRLPGLDTPKVLARSLAEFPDSDPGHSATNSTLAEVDQYPRCTPPLTQHVLVPGTALYVTVITRVPSAPFNIRTQPVVDSPPIEIAGFH